MNSSSHVSSYESTGADPLRRTERAAVDAVKFLSADMVERAASRHPGTPMALAPLGYRLYTKWLRRDRPGLARIRRHHGGFDRFGASAPADAVYRHLDLTPEAMVARTHRLLEGGPR